MCKTVDEPKARPDVGCTELLDALKDWRRCEINHAAIAVGFRVGDEAEAKRAVDVSLNRLRIMAADALKFQTSNK